MASAWQGPRADFAAHFPGGTQSAVPGTLASRVGDIALIEFDNGQTKKIALSTALRGHMLQRE